MYPVLLVEDTPSMQMVYKTLIENSGLKVTSVGSLHDARKAFEAERPRIVVLDLMLPDGHGTEFLTEVLNLEPSTKVIVITSNGSVYTAVEAMRLGAFDFLVKPFASSKLLSLVENAMLKTSLNAKEEVTSEIEIAPQKFGGFIGSSQAMRRIYEMINNVARSSATVFITGESGTGKELCAQALHGRSSRANGPFIALNCGAIPADLLESEVFGHLKGSFTGAVSDKQGAAVAAHGGTLFLDEICELDLALQTKLLRFLQTSMVQPVGSTTPRKVDVRIVCATNKDPYKEVEEGRFREDLFYRLHVVPIHMPPLRERQNDVLEIAEILLKTMSAEEGKMFRAFSREVQAVLYNQDWPGNVRQLINVIRQIVVMNSGEIVTVEMLPEDLYVSKRLGSFDPHLSNEASIKQASKFNNLIGKPMEEIEQIIIEKTIDFCDGSVSRAAELLKMAPSTIYRKRDSWKNNVAG